MSNFADMAYDNYLMHYRTKGSKNGYTKDPDYTPVGERARVEREKAARRNEINMRSAQARRGDYAGMPSSAKEAKERVVDAKAERNKRILAKYEINQLAKQAARGDMGGMPSSAREAKARADRASEISRLHGQRVRGDYAGMPSSALEAKQNAQAARIEAAKARSQKIEAPLKMKRQAEAKRKAEYMKAQAEANRANTTYEKSKRYREQYKKRRSSNQFTAEEMRGKAEDKRLNSPYEKYKREKAASENRDRELLLAENKRRQRVAQKEKKRAEEIERNNADKAERNRAVSEWEKIQSLNKSNYALKSSNGYQSRLQKEKKRVANSGLTGKSLKDLRKEQRDKLLKQYGLTPFSNGKWRKV